MGRTSTKLDIRQSKLIELLRSISTDEFKQLKYFVESPYHNRNTKVVELMAVLSPFYPAFNREELNRQNLHRLVFAKPIFKDLEIRRTMSQLALVVEDFLAWNELAQSPEQKSVLKMHALRQHGLRKHFQKTARDTESLLNSTASGLEQQFLVFRMEQEQEFFAEQLGARRSETRIQEVSESLDLFYMVNKLKIACTAISYEQVFKHRYDISLTHEVLELIEKKDISNPLVNLYRYGLLTMTEPEKESNFTQLKRLLQQNLNIEPKEERNIHVLGQNFCIRNVNRGKGQYFTELFQLYRLGLEKGVIQSDLSQFAPAFKNIVSTGLRVREFDWVEDFILNYSQLLDKNSRSDFRNFNLARLRFDQTRFQEARQFLQEVKFKDVFITLNARVLLIKTFYELDMLDLVEHQIRSFQNFIGRQKNLSYHANIFKDNLRFISRLVRLNWANTREINDLIQDVRQQKTLTERSWLLSKLGASNSSVS